MLPHSSGCPRSELVTQRTLGLPCWGRLHVPRGICAELTLCHLSRRSGTTGTALQASRAAATASPNWASSPASCQHTYPSSTFTAYPLIHLPTFKSASQPLVPPFNHLSSRFYANLSTHLYMSLLIHLYISLPTYLYMNLSIHLHSSLSPTRISTYPCACTATCPPSRILPYVYSWVSAYPQSVYQSTP